MKKSYQMDTDDQEVKPEEANPGSDGKKKMDILYTVSERPPWSLLIILAFQQFLTMFGATFSYPILMKDALCLTGDTVGLSNLISTVIFVSGLSTLIQTTFGIRLPIIQSASYSFVSPFMVLLSLPKWKCTPCQSEASDPPIANVTVCGSDEHKEMWQARLCELQGALLLSCLLQIVVGFTGLVGLLMRMVGPLTIAPTITMIGLSLFDAASFKAQGMWWISLLVVALIAIFSQYLRNVGIPICSYRRGRGCFKSSLRFFALFPVLLSIMIAWLLCYILTITDALTPNRDGWGYLARTDAQGDPISKAPWFRFPYPGQWGVPTISAAGVLGSMAAVVASIVESVGDYHACARLSGAPPPPRSAVSRGIGMEGITCLLAGAWGSGAGTTSYSENIGAIGITKVGSLVVVQVCGIILIVIGCVGKFSALFASLPDPLVGGLFLAMFGMVTAVGLSNLQYVDLNSTRNLFVLGVPLILGLSLPKWMSANPGVIQTGNDVVDSIFTVLASTSMFVAGVVAFFLDNTIPGTLAERGIDKWTQGEEGEEGEQLNVYDLPLIQPWLNKLRCTKYVPFCPGFRGDQRGQQTPRSDRDVDTQNGQVNEGYQSQELHTVL